MGVEAAPGLAVLTFCSYNIARSRRAGEALTRLSPDVACLAEVPGKRWVKGVASSLQARVTYSPTGILAGVAVLLRPPLAFVEWRPIRLRGRGRPALLLALVTGGGMRFAVGAGRLGDLSAERPAQAEALLAAVESYLRLHRCPVVLGLDLEEEPRGKAASLVLERLTDAASVGGCASSATYRGPRPTSRVDYVLAGEGVEVLGCRVPQEEPFISASTHLPVLATLALPSRKMVSP